MSVLATGYNFKRDRKIQGVNIYGWPPNLSSAVQALWLAFKAYYELGPNCNSRDVFHLFNASLRLQTLKKNLHDFDIIHVHGVHHCFLACVSALGVNTPKVLTIHSFSDLIYNSKREFDKRKSFTQKNLDLADFVINVSNENARVAQRFGLIYRTSNRVIYNGIDIYSYTNQNDKRKGLIFVGRLAKIKRVNILLDAVQEVTKENSGLTIVGDGPERAAIERRAKSEPVNYVGGQPNHVARQMIGSSLVLVVPSYSESFGLVYLEALLEGTAVVGYGPIIREFWHVLGLTEHEKDLVAALPEGGLEASELAWVINNTIDSRVSPEGRAAMESIRRKAREEFCWPRITKNVIQVYTEVVQGGMALSD